MNLQPLHCVNHCYIINTLDVDKGNLQVGRWIKRTKFFYQTQDFTPQQTIFLPPFIFKLDLMVDMLDKTTTFELLTSTSTKTGQAKNLQIDDEITSKAKKKGITSGRNRVIRPKIALLGYYVITICRGGWSGKIQ